LAEGLSPERQRWARISTADYIHAMYFFLRQVKAKDVLMIGCGGGTLATMLHTKGVTVAIVDIHKLSFDIARDYFHLPAEISCHVADGIAYLKKHRQRHDAIILDAFGEGGCPLSSCNRPFSNWQNRAETTQCPVPDECDRGRRR
jgi:protein-L-isoaspartate O-methyltransferase